MRDSNNPHDSREIDESAVARTNNVATLDTSSPDDPDLALVIDHWIDLPEAVRAGILAMITTAVRGTH